MDVKLRTNDESSQQPGGLPFVLVVIYIALEYVRPQDIVPGVNSLHLPAVIQTALALSLLLCQKISFSEPQTKVFVALLLLMVIHIPLARNNHWAFHIAKSMMMLGMLHLAIVTFVDTLRRLELLVIAWLCVHLYLGFHSILHRGVGTGGFLADENDLSLTFDMIIPFGFFLGMYASTSKKRVMSLGVTGLLVIANVFTLSRGGFLGMAAVGAFCWMKSGKKLRSAVNLTLLVLLMSVFAPAVFWDEVQSIHTDVDNPMSTGNQRFYQWQLGWTMFLDNPVLGVGQGNYPWNVGAYESGEGWYGRSLGGRAAHSTYITLLGELGLVGGMMFLALVLLNYLDLQGVLKASHGDRPSARNGLSTVQGATAKQEVAGRTVQALALGLQASLLGYLVAGTFVTALYYPGFWITTALTVALTRLSRASLPP